MHNTFAKTWTRLDGPADIADFWQSGERIVFVIAGSGGNRLDSLCVAPTGVWSYSRDLGDLHLDDLSANIAKRGSSSNSPKSRDLRRGFLTTLILLVAAVWIVSFVWLVYLAKPCEPAHAATYRRTRRTRRRPVWKRESPPKAMMRSGGRSLPSIALQPNFSRAETRLVYLTQIASWQALARKTAHELKNSLTPIRLTRRRDSGQTAGIGAAIHDAGSTDRGG
jgi:hypothetical protein